jgi:two-component system alkaline phosphatase synthesis response regulator PhoP
MTTKTKILLIDNDIDFIEMNKAVLQHNGYEVSFAYNSREGYELARLENPDLIVLDLMMEEHDSGFTLAKKIKKDPALKNIPILMLTAVADRTGFKFSQDKDGYWMKTDAFIDKPCPPKDLMEKIKETLLHVKQ